MDEVKTKANCRFTDWWRLLNAEMGKLHHGQEVMFRDARDGYEEGYSPETAARKLWEQWSK